MILPPVPDDGEGNPLHGITVRAQPVPTSGIPEGAGKWYELDIKMTFSAATPQALNTSITATLGGSAVNGTDYVFNGLKSFTVPEGVREHTGSIIIDEIFDDDVSDNKSINLEIALTDEFSERTLKRLPVIIPIVNDDGTGLNLRNISNDWGFRTLTGFSRKSSFIFESDVPINGTVTVIIEQVPKHGGTRPHFQKAGHETHLYNEIRPATGTRWKDDVYVGKNYGNWGRVFWIQVIVEDGPFAGYTEKFYFSAVNDHSNKSGTVPPAPKTPEPPGPPPPPFIPVVVDSTVGEGGDGGTDGNDGPESPSISIQAGPKWLYRVTVGAGDESSGWQDMYKATGLVFNIVGTDDYTGTLEVSISGGTTYTESVSYTAGSVKTLSLGFNGPTFLRPWRDPDLPALVINKSVSFRWKE